MHFCNFLKKIFENFLKIYKKFCLSSKPEKITHGLLNFLKNLLKEYVFRAFPKKSFENFQNFHKCEVSWTHLAGHIWLAFQFLGYFLKIVRGTDGEAPAYKYL